MIGIFIFVCDRGFVVVGEMDGRETLPFSWHLSKSRTIRRWGTTEGLAQLKDGPLAETKLDVVCERTLPQRSVLDIIHLTKEGAQKWAGKLG